MSSLNQLSLTALSITLTSFLILRSMKIKRKFTWSATKCMMNFGLPCSLKNNSQRRTLPIFCGKCYQLWFTCTTKVLFTGTFVQVTSWWKKTANGTSSWLISTSPRFYPVERISISSSRESIKPRPTMMPLRYSEAPMMKNAIYGVQVASFTSCWVVSHLSNLRVAL